MFMGFDHFKEAVFYALPDLQTQRLHEALPEVRHDVLLVLRDEGEDQRQQGCRESLPLLQYL